MGEMVLLKAVSETGAGDVADLGRPFSPAVVQAIISDTATVVLEGSMDGANWFDVATFASSGGADVTVPRYVRGNVPAHTSGVVTLILGVF